MLLENQHESTSTFMGWKTIYFAKIEEVAQWLRTLADLPEEQSSVPSTMSGSSPPPVTPAPRDQAPSSGLCAQLHTCVTLRNTHKHINKNTSFKLILLVLITIILVG